MKIYPEDFKQFNNLSNIGLLLSSKSDDYMFKNDYLKRNPNCSHYERIELKDLYLDIFFDTGNCLSNSREIIDLIKFRTKEIEKKYFLSFLRETIKDSVISSDEYYIFLLTCAQKLKEIFNYDMYKLFYPEQIFDFFEKNYFSLVKEKDFMEYIFLPGDKGYYINIFPVFYNNKVKNYIIFYDKTNKKRTEYEVLLLKDSIKEIKEHLSIFINKKNSFLEDLTEIYSKKIETLTQNINIKEFVKPVKLKLSDIIDERSSLGRIEFIAPSTIKKIIHKEKVKNMKIDQNFIEIETEDKIDSTSTKILETLNIIINKKNNHAYITIPKLNIDTNDFIFSDRDI